MIPDLQKLKTDLVPVVIAAGAAIMRVYEKDPRAELKGDGSPVTVADEAAEAIILSALAKLCPQIVVISEENSESHLLDAPGCFFLVDPLDGTREFMKRDGKGSFTVNIALIDHGQPVLGLVYAPALDRLFTGLVSDDLKLHCAEENGVPISTRARPANAYLAVASVSHRDELTNIWLAENGVTRTVAIGSSLKFGLLACGEADVYPRFGPTMEWDIAAGHAVLAAAGGRMETPDGSPYRYGKEAYRCGPFIAFGSH